jgi:hypothetical protein
VRAGDLVPHRQAVRLGFRRVIGQDTWGASLRRRQALRLVFCPSPVPARARGGG